MVNFLSLSKEKSTYRVLGTILLHCSSRIPTTGSYDQRIARVENIEFGTTTKVHFAINVLGCPSESSIGIKRDCWSCFISIANSFCSDHLHNSGCSKSSNDKSLIGCGLVNKVQQKKNSGEENQLEHLEKISRINGLHNILWTTQLYLMIDVNVNAYKLR